MMDTSTEISNNTNTIDNNVNNIDNDDDDDDDETLYRQRYKEALSSVSSGFKEFWSGIGDYDRKQYQRCKICVKV
ncbi:hypothetical protein HDU76_012629 [Blyttiomyces sp. JEL0837]|nr:hypothetical protein HDU76_012629 [Blyttiomyces sp. JEL0837]